ncbi:MAG: hypothetical protein ACLPVW_11970 [Terriglobales bacterium]
MSFLDYFNSLKPEHRAAWAIAIAADVLQIAAFPIFVEGGMSPADSVLDLIVAFVMIRLLGWHWAFLPTAAAKLIPAADLFPTWTAAVWFVTRQRVSASSEASPSPNPNHNSKDAEILPPGPAPDPRR